MFTTFSDDFIAEYRNKRVPWNGLGYITYKRTYARVMDNGKLEEWVDTIKRCIEGAQRIGANYSEFEAKQLFDHMFNLRAIYSGRMLWRLGTNDKLSKYGDSLNNCWAVSMNSIDAFCFLFEELMCGGGVGYSVRRQDINDLPRIKKDVEVTHEKTNDADFIVPDSREGWVKLLRHVLEAYMYTGKSFTYSTVLVRSAGEPIKGFGGTASGPAILVDGIEKITEVIKKRAGKKLRSVDVLDICNIIGSIVVAGNVRRSAQIALGDADDVLFIRAKRWDKGNIPNWRAFSNNTIYADSYDYISQEVWNGYLGNGEPYGFFNLDLAQSQGRLGEMINDKCELVNPCAEVTLEPYESCNLAELPINNIRSLEEMKEIARLLYKTQKAVAAMPYLYKQTEDVVHRNMRLGLSFTGTVQAMDKLEWLDEVYRDLREFDKVWSKERGWPESIKLTSQKPSGTVSLLTGSTPGVHPAFAPYYIRRVRIASDSVLVPIMRQLGYTIEYVRGYDGTPDYGTSVIEFPVKMDNAIYAKDVSAVDQLELVKKVQTVWADNSVSVTVYYRKEELDSIRAWMSENYKDLKTVSFLLHSDHGFDQAPYEEITESQYDRMVEDIQEITPGVISALEEWFESDCQGACPVK